MTEDRLLTTSYRTVGKSPETFGSYTPMRVESHAHREGGAYITATVVWFLPIQQSECIWIFHSKRDELDVSLCEVLLFETIYCAFSIFLIIHSRR